MKNAPYEVEELEQVASRIAYSVGILNHNDREDCMQEIQVAMWQAGIKADPERNVKGYQWQTGKGVALNFRNLLFDHNDRFRTVLNGATSVEDEDCQLYETMDNGFTGPESRRMNTEMFQSFLDAVDSLPEVTSNVIRGKLLDGKTIETLALELGISKTQVGNRYQSGVELLKVRMAQWNPARD